MPTKCDICGTIKKALLISEYCPNEDCGNTKEPDTDPGFIPTGINAAFGMWGPPLITTTTCTQHLKKYRGPNGTWCYDCGALVQ